MSVIAVYSRKSKWTGKGESVENQIVMCREYINRFIEGGEAAEIVVYEDEGFSGKNTKRPQFQQMLRDMKERHFDCLVCYKIDRLGRNLADLVNLMEDLERGGTSFVSIKEKFDTTTPIGKAMLYFSGVLAQMEREQIAERVKDNMVMLARSGRWLGGNTPFGYTSVRTEKETAGPRKKAVYCLAQKPEEIGLARVIFETFLEDRSITKVLERLLLSGARTRNGKEFTISGIRDILGNPVYCIADEEAFRYFYELGCQVCIDKEELDGESGLMGYAKTSSARYKNQNMPSAFWIIAKGRHKGIVSGAEYVRVQRLLEDNRSRGAHFRDVSSNRALLSGLFYCTCGHQMRPKNYPASRVTETGERTFSYRCPYKDRTHGERCGNQNAHGNTLDSVVSERILQLAAPDAGILPMLEAALLQIVEGECGTGIMPEQERLRLEYDKKKEEIRRLLLSVRQLEADSVSAQCIYEEIRKLDGICAGLRERLQEQEGGEDSGNPEEYAAEMAEKLLDFPELFAAFSLARKRAFLREVIDRVVWDGETAHIYPVSDV